jgi:hypothetical protein
MTTRNDARAGALFGGALTTALQWRLLAVWAVGLLLPTLLVWLPLWRALGGILDLSPRAAELAQRFDLLAAEDVSVALGKAGGALGGAMLPATILALLLAPFLAGVTATAARRAGEAPLGVVELVQGGVAWYGRMFRMALVALVPLGAVGVIASLAFKLAGKRAETAVLESQATNASHAATLVVVIFFVLAHATIEAGRAQLVADPALRSAWRAWVRGLGATVRQPLAVLGLYVGITLVSLVVAAVPLLLRIRVAPAGAATFWIAFLLTQLGVAAIGWGRAARLFALVGLTPVQAVAPPAATPAPTPAPA